MKGARCMSALLCMGLRSCLDVLYGCVLRLAVSSLCLMGDGSVDGNETTTGDWCLKGMCSAVR
jgi:hypothetical protein